MADTGCSRHRVTVHGRRKDAHPERCLGLPQRVDQVYRLGNSHVRCVLNQSFFSRLLLDGEQDRPHVTGSTLQEPWTTLLARAFQARMRHNTTNPDRDLLCGFDHENFGARGGTRTPTPKGKGT